MIYQFPLMAKGMFRTALAALLLATVVAGLTVGCTSQIRVVEVEVTAAPQVRVVEVTATPSPTSTPPPPTATPAPTTVTVCATGCGFTAIQAAIDAAVTVTGGVIIVTDAVHTEGDITVNKDITIRGQGADSTIVEAHDTAESATDRVFLVEVGTAATIKDITIRHGHPDLEPRLGGIRRSGGGIVNRGALTLEDSIVSDNIGNSGGGIFNTGTLTLTNCVVSGNTADGIGEPGHRCGSGGGIKNVGQATLWLINSTISDNNVVGNGGGIKSGCVGRATLINSTISGNSANGRGGGIHAFGSVVLINCTISGNSAVGIGRGRMSTIGNGGGGVYIQDGTLYYTNTIIANSAIDPNSIPGGDCVVGENGAIGANINNLVEDNSCSPDYSGDPLLGPLADNSVPAAGLGQTTWTHALLPGSPAIDAIPAGECTVGTDQRGISRPQGAACDIGAFELQMDE